ncbi:uncharacterized protein G2W53_041673 [Senna tora]|uniref:Uncharacterized protein n=1 Tax=Senna tora TaxID=362788 RepID=A0A834SKB0_9FABA|nr:uncharacterized protein G2W53_041673 [Senna tora]
MLQLDSSWHGRSVDHDLTYSGRKIAIGSQKPSRTTWKETFSACETNTFVRVVFSNRSGFDDPIGVVLAWEERGSGFVLSWEEHGSCLNILRMKNQVVLAWEERGSCLNIFQMKNCTRISVFFTNYEAKDLLLVLEWEERGSCLNIFRRTNHGRITATFTNYKEKDFLRKSMDHVLTYFGRQIAVKSQKASRITRQKTCCASEANTSVRIVFANMSGFDAPIVVVLAWEECGSCLNIFRTTKHGRISETFMNYEAKDLLRKRVDHVLTYSGRQIGVGSQRPSRITRQNTCCARESNTSVRVVFANRSGFDAPIGVVLAWEERGIESNTSVRVVFANRSGFDAPIAVVLAWEERGSCLNIFRMKNRGRISETFTNYEAKDLLRKSCLNIFRMTIRGRITETFTNYEAKDSLHNRLGMGGAWIMSQHIPDDKSRSDLRVLHELRGKRLVAQVSQTRRFALYLRTVVDLMFLFESS